MDPFSSGNSVHRQQLAEHLFHEVQAGNKKSSKELFEVLNQELNNWSDRAIEIRLQQLKS